MQLARTYIKCLIAGGPHIISIYLYLILMVSGWWRFHRRPQRKRREAPRDLETLPSFVFYFTSVSLPRNPRVRDHLMMFTNSYFRVNDNDHLPACSYDMIIPAEHFEKYNPFYFALQALSAHFLTTLFPLNSNTDGHLIGERSPTQ